MQRAVLAALAGLMALAVTEFAAAAEVNVYSLRQEFLIRPFLDKFAEETGITVNTVYTKDGVQERLEAEGAQSPADVVLTVDIARLDQLAKAGLLQPVSSPVLEQNIPAQFRHPDGLWYALTARARIIYASKERVQPGEISTYEELADPKWKGRICMRSSKHDYNRALAASMLAAHGEAETLAWMKALRENQARKPQGNDRSQVKAIKEGLCDLALGNTYYYGAMKFNEKQPEQKTWADAVNLIFPNADGRGTHVNISGVAMTKSAKNKDAAIRLIEFLSRREAQAMYAELNYEYAVNPAVQPDPEVASWGALKPDPVSLQSIAELSPKAAMLFDQAGFE